MANKKYDQEFRLRAVKHALDSELPVNRSAKELGISDSALGKWIKEYQANGGNSLPGASKVSLEAQRISELEKRVREAELERDILKKAVAFFAKEK
jgi:transposase